MSIELTFLSTCLEQMESHNTLMWLNRGCSQSLMFEWVSSGFVFRLICPRLTCIINWVVRSLNADWLTAVVYWTVYHGYDNTYFYSCNYVGNQFIIANMHLWRLWYIGNVPRLRSVSRHSALCVRTALSRGIMAVYRTPPEPYCLSRAIL